MEETYLMVITPTLTGNEDLPLSAFIPVVEDEGMDYLVRMARLRWELPLQKRKVFTSMPVSDNVRELPCGCPYDPSIRRFLHYTITGKEKLQLPLDMVRVSCCNKVIPLPDIALAITLYTRNKQAAV